MKAIITERYGTPDVLEFKETAKPTPKDNEVLVKIHAASLNMFDWHLLTADIFLVRLNAGFFKPKYKIPGADVAGRVEAVGKNVTQFKVGDEVYGDLAASGCGSFAEYVAVPEKALALKPVNLTFEEAAAFPMAAVTALQGLRDAGKIQAGHKVLIQGASGGVGSFAVQIAKVLGAEVTAVCSTRNMELVRSLGADHVIDYTKEDFTKNRKQYDLILAVNGYHPITDYKDALTPKGMYVMAGGTTKQIFEAVLRGSFVSEKDGRKLGALTAQPKQADLIYLKGLAEAGKIKPVIDKRYPLSETAQALRYLGEGHARGKVILTVAS
ncbi:MAG: NAD(P)-dependent alcohol dehydrogenase [Anaerolineales bacterium]|uniref:NAD(P)-dependent alcohol dehydrogenase n=1 Tax=Candidatus Villigracilis vicinus TaxID=3140679 RepID=UPI0031365DD5|nr:NAD(P)-dependent alcohol dehydrogenase [Anaerolineales bacterium]